MLKAALVVALVVGIGRQDVDNPTYKTWAKFKVGSSVTLHSDNLTNGIKSEAEIIYTLKSLDDKEAVVTMTGSTTVNGTKNDMTPGDAVHPAKVKKAEIAKDAAKPEEGKEQIEIAGKKVKCHWVKTVAEHNGMKTTTKVWSSDEIPGGMAKKESVTEGKMKMSSTMTVTAIDKK